MIPALEIWVSGVPRPQGSKRHVGGGRMLEASPYIRVWRATMCQAARSRAQQNGWATLTGPVEVVLDFYMPRPRHHYRQGRHSHLLRDTAPMLPMAKPDLDKMARGCLDALTDAEVMRDDSLVVRLGAAKWWAVEDGPGVRMCVIGLPGHDLTVT